MISQNRNIFTVDLEDWYHSFYLGYPLETNEFRIVEPTEKILKLLKQTKNKATFFAVGEVAQRHPELIKEISKQGHEIAGHSFNHQFVYNQSESEFEADLKKTKGILEELISKKVIGYRAPAWTVDSVKTPWYWKVLKRNGIIYSSSIFPFKTFLYGDNKAERFLNKKDKIMEIPPSVYEFLGLRIPFSGGFYLRSLPLNLITFFSREINKKGFPVVYYIHPRELDLDQPKLELSLSEKFIHYHNLETSYAKLVYLTKNNLMASIKDYYGF